MKLLRLLLLLSVIGISMHTHAQAKLYVQANALNSIPDTVPYNYNDTLQVWIYNKGNQTAFGPIEMYNSTGTGGTDSASGQGSIEYNFTADSIQAGDSIQATLFFHFGGSQFPPAAPSGVVIWPVANSSLTLDSASKVVYVLNVGAGITKIATDNLKVYTDGNELYIKSQGLPMPVHVRIYDITGALLQESEISSNLAILPISQYATGAYLAEVILPGNERLVYKVVK